VLAASPAGMKAFAFGPTAQPTLDAVTIPSSDGKGWTLEAAIPWTALGVTPTPGSTLRFDLTVIDGDGARAASRVAWSVTGDGGRLLLAP
jgi:hypothetical protein